MPFEGKRALLAMGTVAMCLIAFFAARHLQLVLFENASVHDLQVGIGVRNLRESTRVKAFTTRVFLLWWSPGTASLDLKLGRVDSAKNLRTDCGYFEGGWFVHYVRASDSEPVNIRCIRARVVPVFATPEVSSFRRAVSYEDTVAPRPAPTRQPR
jgi:hypothetical protein